MRRFAAALVALAAGTARGEAAAVVALTEANFDAETRIGTPSPRPYFVEFFAPWCGHCKKLAPAWEELAQKLAADGHATAVGAVDATIHKGLATRFGVRGFPTLVLFAEDGQMFKYTGSRGVDELEAFAKGGFKKYHGTAVPAPPTMLSEMRDALTDLFNAIVALYRNQFAAALVMTSIALFAGLTIGFAAGLVLAPTPAPPPRRPPAAATPAPQPAINADAKSTKED
ncbi:hypothetical protein KFE25_012066 [Diacronema lutheri]|uniref:Thioredoxin domain-containing protein n=1 Tax=Diacronema lutheri TaxID=2081491 RepID=A0A7R9YN15_DIALT|nr:hypothetical protein KFE25_012066 [Diacronema lutheri]|mmetsp:Transcript_4440/g.13691  ORF Transcript_4440/g.13691 Transcript_4440/m.13691 type:complete len:228 (+) Transcript_4440:27-710(+)